MPAEAPVHGARVAAVDAKVVANRALCQEHVRIDVTLPDFPASTPGQFLQLRCGPANPDAISSTNAPRDGLPSPVACTSSGAPLLRRPFSIADRTITNAGETCLSVISRTVGSGTRWLEQLRTGDTLNLTGPLGRGFTIPQSGTPIILVGGGVGIPPLLYLARRLHETGHTAVTAIFGVTCRNLLPLELSSEPPRDARPTPCVTLPAGAPFPAIITSDDGSIGMKGVVTLALEQYLAALASPTIMACGPNPMLRAVATVARRHNAPAQLCIERNMGCGLGTCLSCIVRAHDAARPSGWHWALTCTDGPVFDRDALFDYDDAPASG